MYDYLNIKNFPEYKLKDLILFSEYIGASNQALANLENFHTNIKEAEVIYLTEDPTRGNEIYYTTDLLDAEFKADGEKILQLILNPEKIIAQYLEFYFSTLYGREELYSKYDDSYKEIIIYLPEMDQQNDDSSEYEKYSYLIHGIKSHMEDLKERLSINPNDEKIKKTVTTLYEELKNEIRPEDERDIRKAIAGGVETIKLEFKSTIDFNQHTGNKDKKQRMGFMEEVNAFLNTKGGQIIVGVEDERESGKFKIVGIDDTDLKLAKTETKLEENMTNHYVEYFQENVTSFITTSFVKLDKRTCMLIKIDSYFAKTKKLVYFRTKHGKNPYTRHASSSIALNASQIVDYLQL